MSAQIGLLGGERVFRAIQCCWNPYKVLSLLLLYAVCCSHIIPWLRRWPRVTDHVLSLFGNHPPCLLRGILVYNSGWSPSLTGCALLPDCLSVTHVCSVPLPSILYSLSPLLSIRTKPWGSTGTATPSLCPYRSPSTIQLLFCSSWGPVHAPRFSSTMSRGSRSTLHPQSSWMPEHSSTLYDLVDAKTCT